MSPDRLAFIEAPEGHLFETRALVTTRIGGNSDPPFATLNLGRSTPDDPERVRGNEAAVLRALALPDRVARLRLEHGSRIATALVSGMHGLADGILCQDPELVLWLTIADCYPVAYVLGDCFALAHCGWRGVAAGLPRAMIHALVERSERPSAEARVWIGPGIGACCYEVGPEVATRFPAEVLRYERTTAPGHAQLDLVAAISAQLTGAGVGALALASSALCTACDSKRFYSHRRDGFPSGRMAALIFRQRSTL